MKKIFLLACFLMNMTQQTHAMGGAICGIIAPSLIGPCYVACSSAPMKKKVGEWALLTLGNAMIGGMSQLACYALIAKPGDAISATASTAFALSSGITLVWLLEKTVQKSRKLSKEEFSL